MENSSTTHSKEVTGDNRVYPAWVDNRGDPGYDDCARALWNLAEGLAGKFLSTRGPIANYAKEDLAGEAVLHAFIKISAGKLRKVPVEERWKYIRRMLWNRMVDVARKRNEVQVGSLDTDATLEALAPLDLAAIRRAEVQSLEDFIHSALNALPAPCGFLIQLRFGLWRSDEFGSEFPQTGEPLSLRVLADAGFGDSELDVHRRIQDSLERLRGILIYRLSRQGVRNFEGYHLPKAA
ncbi:MAG: hypothetical protein WB680_15465 [Candidatus Acidiferrales bacterium]